MRYTYKRILAALSAGLILLSFSACGQTTDPDAEGATSAVTEEADTDEQIYDDLPTGSYGGYEFNVLQYKEQTAATATVLTERTGNPIEDKIYERMVAVEERLDVRFANNLEDLNGAVSRLRNSIAGGLDEYDVFWCHSTTTVSNFLASASLVDLNSIDTFDFSKPWWDDTANQHLALDEHTYMAFGDINIYLFDFHSTILFNKDVTDEHRLDLYGMVKNGTWTMEEFIRLSTDLALLASDNPTNSRLGYSGTALATIFGFLHGADVSLLTYDDSGIPTLAGVDEAYLDTMTAYNVLFKNSSLSNPSDYNCVTTFASQKTVFVSCGVGQIGQLRDEEMNYGLVPFPKRSVAQKEYISFVTNQIQPMVVPKSATNTERTGVILENLAAESYRQVRPEYFDVLLHSKYVRDPESLENVRLLFNSETRFELEHIYNWAGLEDTVVRGLTQNVGSFTSSIKATARVANKSIEKTLKYLQKGAEQ